MEIFKKIQYNQSVGKYKVLSSNAGVGSIITTKAGFFVMPQSISFWNFIMRANSQTQRNRRRKRYRSSGHYRKPSCWYEMPWRIRNSRW